MRVGSPTATRLAADLKDFVAHVLLTDGKFCGQVSSWLSPCQWGQKGAEFRGAAASEMLLWQEKRIFPLSQRVAMLQRSHSLPQWLPQRNSASSQPAGAAP